MIMITGWFWGGWGFFASAAFYASVTVGAGSNQRLPNLLAALRPIASREEREEFSWPLKSASPQGAVGSYFCNTAAGSTEEEMTRD